MSLRNSAGDLIRTGLAQALEPPLDLRISERGVDLAIEQIDDFRRSVGRRANSGPAAPHITWHRLTDGRDIRQDLRARRGRDRKRTNPAGPYVLNRRGQVVEHDLNLTAHEVGQRRHRAAVWHMQ